MHNIFFGLPKATKTELSMEIFVKNKFSTDKAEKERKNAKDVRFNSLARAQINVQQHRTTKFCLVLWSMFYLFFNMNMVHDLKHFKVNLEYKGYQRCKRYKGYQEYKGYVVTKIIFPFEFLPYFFYVY